MASITITDQNLTKEEITFALANMLQTAPSPIMNMIELLKVDADDDPRYIRRLKQVWNLAYQIGLYFRFSSKLKGWMLVRGPFEMPEGLNSDENHFFETFMEVAYQYLKGKGENCIPIEELRKKRELSNFIEEPIRFRNDFKEKQNGFHRNRDEIGSFYYQNKIQDHEVFIHEYPYSRNINTDDEIQGFDELIAYLKELHYHKTLFVKMGNKIINFRALREILSHLPESRYSGYIHSATNTLIITSTDLTLLVLMPWKDRKLEFHDVEKEFHDFTLGLSIGRFDDHLNYLENNDFIIIKNSLVEITSKAFRYASETEVKGISRLLFYRDIDNADREIALDYLRQITGLTIEIKEQGA